MVMQARNLTSGTEISPSTTATPSLNPSLISSFNHVGLCSASTIAPSLTSGLKRTRLDDDGEITETSESQAKNKRKQLLKPRLQRQDFEKAQERNREDAQAAATARQSSTDNFNKIGELLAELRQSIANTANRTEDLFPLPEVPEYVPHAPNYTWDAKPTNKPEPEPLTPTGRTPNLDRWYSDGHQYGKNNTVDMSKLMEMGLAFPEKPCNCQCHESLFQPGPMHLACYYPVLTGFENDPRHVTINGPPKPSGPTESRNLWHEVVLEMHGFGHNVKGSGGNTVSGGMLGMGRYWKSRRSRLRSKFWGTMD
jgi:hypothetical protein